MRRERERGRRARTRRKGRWCCVAVRDPLDGRAGQGEEEEEDAGAGAEATSRGRSSREQVEAQGEAQQLLSRTNSIASTKRQKDSFGRGTDSLSLSLDPIAPLLSSFSSSLPAISLSLSLLFDGALRCAQETRQRRRNARPAHRVHTCTTYYTSVRPSLPAASHRADKDGLKLAPCQSTESTEEREREREISRRLRAVSSHGGTEPAVRVCPWSFCI